MRRREFLGILSGAATWPLSARAQQTGRSRRIAVLMGSAQTELGKNYLATFLRQLEQLGWIEGRNARIEVRWWLGGPEEMRPVAAELLAASPDVVMVFSNLALALLQTMAKEVPIVFVGVGDPIGDGFVSNLAKPGGTVTGFAGTDGPIGGKWLEVLKETVPHVTRVMMIYHPQTPIHQAFLSKMDPVDSVLILSDPVYTSRSSQIARILLARKMPSVSQREIVVAGGLLGYGANIEEAYRQAGAYTGRILKGEKPSDLPVLQPTRFELAINLKTARVLGITVPATLLARADEVIE